MKEEKSLSRFTLPVLMVGMAATNLATGNGYERVCVPIGDDEVQCVETNKVEKFLSGMGAHSLAFPTGGGDSLLVCGDGLLFGSEAGTDIGDGIFRMDIPLACSAPEKPKGTRLYGPKTGKGGEFCSGRENRENCKDCCLSVALAQAGMVAAAGKMYRDSKPGPKGLAADAVVEVASYGLIYWSRHNCDDNCGVSYEVKERTR